MYYPDHPSRGHSASTFTPYPKGYAYQRTLRSGTLSTFHKASVFKATYTTLCTYSSSWWWTLSSLILDIHDLLPGFVRQSGRLRYSLHNGVARNLVSISSIFCPLRQRLRIISRLSAHQQLEVPFAQISQTLMTEPVSIPRSKSEAADLANEISVEIERVTTGGSSHDSNQASNLTPSESLPQTPVALSRNVSFTNASSYSEDWEAYPPLDKLTVFDFLGNLALPQRFEQWQTTISAQRERVKRQQERIRSTGLTAKQLAVKEWRKRLPTAEEQLEKYRARMKSSVDRLGRKWSDTAAVTMREKMSFMAGVLNVFISGYLIGAQPAAFYYWFTAQLCYFMPLRFYTYHKKGYHYFLADLCYFVNLLTMLTIWVFPTSKRLFISTYCLAYGNNAVAVAMWRNSMVFHSLDKVTSLFIHIMPPVTLHCLVHLTPAPTLASRFPALYNIKFSAPSSPEHYTLWSMLLWATVPYAIWQFSYHIFITVRRREKIAAGRPTSFTWMRRSYAKTWIGRFVLSLPEWLQEPAFMLIQYSYAVLTIIPCPIWFWYRWASSAFLLVVFGWSIYNGATYYIDVFGKRFQSELEALKRDVAKWQNGPADGSMGGMSPPLGGGELLANGNGIGAGDGSESGNGSGAKREGVDEIPLLDTTRQFLGSTAVDLIDKEGITGRKQT